MPCQNWTDLLSRMAIYRMVFTFFILGGLVSCSVEKNTSLSRNFHNLTSHYNIYFNGYESYKKGIEKAQSTVRNDYNRILPLFLAGGKHVDRDIPVQVEQLAWEIPEVEVEILPPVGEHPKVAAAIREIAAEALD